MTHNDLPGALRSLPLYERTAAALKGHHHTTAATAGSRALLTQIDGRFYAVTETPGRAPLYTPWPAPVAPATEEGGE